MDIGRELVQLRKKLESLERASRLTHASIENTALQVNDGSGNLRAIVGVQADGTTAVNVVNGPPPPQPSAPLVISVLGGVAASWDGTFAGGATLPLDWQRIEVHASTTSGFTPDATTLTSTIETPRGSTAVVRTDVPVYVRLVARNTSGAASPSSDPTGPFGPTAVVASDVLDGIVTTVKLADDAVTQAKVAVAAISATELADSAVTTGKLAAGSVQTAALAADSVAAGKIAADAVTSREIAALSVTSNKIAANTIVAGNLAAGSVDATALNATAITGKTITGGTVTGALIQTAATGERITLNEAAANKVLVYNAAGTAIGELSVNGLLVKGTNGAILQLDPNNAFPNLKLTNINQTTSAIINISGANALLGQNSGLFTSAGNTDWKWRTVFGVDGGSDVWAAERVRDSSPSTTYLGGRIFLTPTQATFGFQNAADATQDSYLNLLQGLAQLVQGRLQIVPPASASSGLYVNAASAHTGNLARLDLNSSSKFTVDKDGNTTAAGMLAAGNLAVGHVTITPVANTPTSVNVTGLSLQGTVRVVATANTSVPGTSVTGVGVNNITSTGFTVWLTRTNTSSTGVDWIAMGE